MAQTMPKNLEPDRVFKKDVKIAGTNSISFLESAKGAKNELKTNPKRTPNEAKNRAAETQNGPNEAHSHGFSQPRAMLETPKAGGELKKDVKIAGTNSISSLESAKVTKNELKTNSKRTPKVAENGAVKAHPAQDLPHGPPQVRGRMAGRTLQPLPGCCLSKLGHTIVSN